MPANQAQMPPPVQCDAYYGGLGAPVQGNHVPPPHKLTRTNREMHARNYLGISYNLVKGPNGYDTNKQLERGYGMRSDTDVVGYFRAPKLVIPASTAPQQMGALSTTREVKRWAHGGTFGGRAIPTRTAMPGAGDGTQNRLQPEHPWASSLGFAKNQLATNPFWQSIN